jgi:hypothetical protein
VREFLVPEYERNSVGEDNLKAKTVLKWMRIKIMTKQKFVDTNTKEAIEECLKVVKHRTVVLWRQAIEAGRAWVEAEIGVGEARKYAFDSHASAREADDKSAIAAARSAGQSVASAHVIDHAIHASIYAVKSLAYTTNFDSIAIANERTWQYQHLLNLGKTY